MAVIEEPRIKTGTRRLLPSRCIGRGGKVGMGVVWSAEACLRELKTRGQGSAVQRGGSRTAPTKRSMQARRLRYILGAPPPCPPLEDWGGKGIASIVSSQWHSHDRLQFRNPALAGNLYRSTGFILSIKIPLDSRQSRQVGSGNDGVPPPPLHFPGNDYGIPYVPKDTNCGILICIRFQTLRDERQDKWKSTS